MNSIKSKAAYIQGMMDGLALDLSGKEGKVLSEIVKVLDEIGDRLEELQNNQDSLEIYVDELDDSLQCIEGDFYGFEETDDYIQDDEFIEVQCPHCSEVIYIDKSIVDNKEALKCPNCNFDLINEEN